MRERKPGTWELIVPIGKDALTGRARYRSRSLRGTTSISKIEHAEDLRISTLRKYIEALGAELKLDAEFQDGRRIPLVLGTSEAGSPALAVARHRSKPDLMT